VGVEEDVVPALWRSNQGGKLAMSCGPLVRYGRQLFAARRLWSGNHWNEGVELHVEVFDRMDGLQLMSARGQLGWEVDEEEKHVQLFLNNPDDDPLVEVRGASFSAASRDPEQRRFANIGAYFTEGHLWEYPCSLSVRVTVWDRRTGKLGVLWEEDKGTEWVFLDPDSFGQQRLPEGTKLVGSKAVGMVGIEGDGLCCDTNLYLLSEPDQEDVAEQDRRYRVAVTEDTNDRAHPFSLSINSTDVGRVGSIIRSLLV
jgi:hypothetical protein